MRVLLWMCILSILAGCQQKKEFSKEETQAIEQSQLTNATDTIFDGVYVLENQPDSIRLELKDYHYKWEDKTRNKTYSGAFYLTENNTIELNDKNGDSKFKNLKKTGSNTLSVINSEENGHDSISNYKTVVFKKID